MRFRFFRMRFRRRLRAQQQQVEALGSTAERHFEQNVLHRLDRLVPVRRFVITWLVLIMLIIGGLIAQNIALSNHFQTLRPVPGGVFNEGILGTFTNANPIYATNDADSSVSRLVFSGLMQYDQHNRLVGDLASSYSVDDHGQVYTLHLRPHLSWHDGKALTSKDVAFTYHLIQNPDTQSPLRSNWQGIDISAPDPQTVVFKLPSPLASFVYNLTNGIVPEHALRSVAPSDLRSSDFNTVHPIGAGPFKWRSIQVTGSEPAKAQEQIALEAFDAYQPLTPKLQAFNVHVYADKDQLIDGLKSGQLTAAEGLSNVPNDLAGQKNLLTNNLMLNAATMVFFKTSSGVLSDKVVRQSLVEGANVPKIIEQLGYQTLPVREPILARQVGYDPSLKQAGYDLTAAKKLLDANGWIIGEGGFRHKGGQTLRFSLAGIDTAEHRQVGQQLQKQWRQLGADLQLRFQDSNDFQSTLNYHNYDAVLHGIDIGVDPDVFVYWDSSQADARSDHRLNLSEYKNPTADASLEAGRTRLDPSLRAVKYRPFLEAWQQDNPALGLYQPRLLYLTTLPVFGLPSQSINTTTNRLNNVQNWEIRLAKVTN